MRRDVMLLEDDALRRVQSCAEKIQCHLMDILKDWSGISVFRRQSMHVRNEEVALILVLQPHPVVECAHVVAEVQPSRGARAAQYAPSRCRCRRLNHVQSEW